jgi:hypothetical protein
MWIARLQANGWWLLACSVFGIALLVALELVRPFIAGPVGFDSAASVIHFDRIVAGRHLEAFVTATPKPLLTVVYGVLHAVTGDWRAVSLATILCFAICVVLGGVLAWRVAGPPAGAAAVVGLLGSEALLADVGISYALPWALVFWLAAGLAMTGPRPRPGLAGVALCLATLARLETIVLVGVAIAAVAVATALGRAWGRPVPRRSWLVALGLGALPVMLVHDWLLTGDPFFWLSVSTRFSQAAPDSVLAPVELLRLAATRYLGMALLVVLAVVGFLALARRRGWVPLIGIVGLVPGVGVFLLLLAARGTYVSSRYFGAIDLGLVFAAAIGAAVVAQAVQRMIVGAVSARRQGLMPAAVVVAAAAIAVGASWPMPSFNASFRSSVRAQRTLAEHLDRTLPILRCRVAPLAARPPATSGVGTAQDLSELVILVPSLSRPRLAVDLDLPVNAVGGTPAAWLGVGPGFLPYGRYVIHDRLGDRPTELFGVLEVDQPTTVGSVKLVPILADREAGLWVLRIDRTGSAPAGGC